MTVEEFKAWFEGYTENISKLPTQKQWARVKERVGEVEGESGSSVTIFRDYQRPYPYRPWWPDKIYCGNDTTVSTSTNLSYSNASNHIASSENFKDSRAENAASFSGNNFVCGVARALGRDEAAMDAS